MGIIIVEVVIPGSGLGPRCGEGRFCQLLRYVLVV